MKKRILRAVATLAVAGAVSAGATAADESKVSKKDLPPLKPLPATLVPPQAAMPGPAPVVVGPSRPIEVVHSSPPVMMAEDCGGGGGGDDCRAFGAFGDFLYLKARGVDLLFARSVDGCIPGAQSPRGPIASAQPNYSPGFRVGGFYGWDDSSIVATYTWFNSESRDTLVAPNTNVIQALVTLPNTPNCAAVGQRADADYDIDFQFIDLDYRHAFCSGANYSVDWLVGVRYAHLDQDLQATFNILGTTRVTSQINFDGAGPRVGLAGERINCRGLLVFGRSSASFLAGHFDSSISQRNNFAGNQGSIQYDNDRIVPILDLEVGVGWASSGGRFRVEAGYYIAGWFNTLTTPGLIRAAQTNDFSGTGDVLRETLTFDGFTLRAAVKF